MSHASTVMFLSPIKIDMVVFLSPKVILKTASPLLPLLLPQRCTFPSLPSFLQLSSIKISSVTTSVPHLMWTLQALLHHAGDTEHLWRSRWFKMLTCRCMLFLWGRRKYRAFSMLRWTVHQCWKSHKGVKLIRQIAQRISVKMRTLYSLVSPNCGSLPAVKTKGIAFQIICFKIPVVILRVK